MALNDSPPRATINGMTLDCTDATAQARLLDSCAGLRGIASAGGLGYVGGVPTRSGRAAR